MVRCEVSPGVHSIVTLATLVGSLLCSYGCAKPERNRDLAVIQKEPVQSEIEAAEPKSTESAEIEWMDSVSEGLTLAKEKQTPAFIDFYADWCPPCQQMDKVTFRDTSVIEELARFTSIKADMTRTSSKGRPAAKEYGVQAIPTYVFIDTQGKQTIEVGYRSPDRFLRKLKSIK